MTHTAARPAWGWGLATVHQSGQVLDTWFAAPVLGVYEGAEAPLMLQVTTDARRGTRTEPMVVQIDLDVAPQSVPDAYLRLHLLSHRLVKPHEVNLDGFRGLGEVIHLFGPRLGDAALPIEAGDHERFAFVEVDGPFVDAERAGAAVHFADDDGAMTVSRDDDSFAKQIDRHNVQFRRYLAIVLCV